MSSHSGEAAGLLKGAEMGREVGRGEAGPVIGVVLLRDHSNIPAHIFESGLALQRFVTVEERLKLNMYVAGGVINKYRAAGVFLVVRFFSASVELATFS
jgi:hypothetical protein